MARTIPASYPKPNPDLSFVSGSGFIDDGSGTQYPPHGPRDLALALNYLFAYGGANVLIPQVWRNGEGIKNTTAGFPASADLVYRVPADTAFTTFEVCAYYIGNHVNAGGIKVKIVELNEEMTLATEDVNGAQARAYDTWAPAGVADYAGEYFTVEVFVFGKSVDPNELTSFTFERLHVTANNVPSGLHYNDSFIGIDSTAVDSDSPLSSDIMFDLRRGIDSLKTYRKRSFVQWSRQSGTVSEGNISTLVPILVTGRTNTNEPTGYVLGGSASADFHVCGGKAGIASGERYVTEQDATAGQWKDATGRLEGNGLFPIDAPYQQVFCQAGSLITEPPEANLAAMRSISLWGF